MSASIRRIAVLVSGGGTNLQSLIDARGEGFFRSKIVLVLSNREDAYGLVRARNADIPAYVATREEDLLRLLEEYKVDLIVLAGYLRILGKEFLKVYEGRIINIHPSLLPKHGGMGMYGIHVHEAVFAAGEEVSGASVHYVSEAVDAGEIILQEAVDIRGLSSPQEIQKKVLEVEHRILKQAVKKIEEEIK